MTRIAIAAIAHIFLGLAGTAGGATQYGAQVPSLVVADTRPFVVRGVGFEPRERVQVLLAVNGSQRWQGTVASSSGVFVVRFSVAIGACSRFTIKALGSKGSSARIVPRRASIDCVSPAGGGGSTS